MADVKRADDLDRIGWWPCACVKGGNWRKRKPSTHIKLNAPTLKRCGKCGVTQAESNAAGATYGS